MKLKYFKRNARSVLIALFKRQKKILFDYKLTVYISSLLLTQKISTIRTGLIFLRNSVCTLLRIVTLQHVKLGMYYMRLLTFHVELGESVMSIIVLSYGKAQAESGMLVSVEVVI